MEMKCVREETEKTINKNADKTNFNKNELLKQ